MQTLDGLIAALRKTSSAPKLVAVKLDTQTATDLMSRSGPKPHLMERAIHPILVDTHPHNRSVINRSLKRFGMFENLNWLAVEGHPDHRQMSAGKVEDTRVFTYVND